MGVFASQKVDFNKFYKIEQKVYMILLRFYCQFNFAKSMLECLAKLNLIDLDKHSFIMEEHYMLLFLEGLKTYL